MSINDKKIGFDECAIISQSQGMVAISMAEIIHRKTLKDTFQLDAAKHGQLQLELRWMSILNGA